MDELRMLLILLCCMVLTSGCERGATPVIAPSGVSTAAPDTSNKTSPSIEKTEQKPSPAELKRKEMETAFEEFLAAQDEPDPDKWKQRYDNSFEALLKYGKDVLPILLEALQHKDQKVRESASIIISAIGPSTPAESGQFITYLKDESEMVRVNLVACLSLLPEHTEVAVEQLKSLLKCKDESIRSTAAGSAANLGEKATPLADLLIEIVAEDHSNAKNLALEALSSIPTFTEVQLQTIEKIASQDQQDPNITQKLKSILEKK